MYEKLYHITMLYHKKETELFKIAALRAALLTTIFVQPVKKLVSLLSEHNHSFLARLFFLLMMEFFSLSALRAPNATCSLSFL